MRNKFVKITIVVFTAMVIIFLFKNTLIELFIGQKLATKNIYTNNISCKGFYNISCNIENLSTQLDNNITKFNINIDEIILNNLINIYKNYDKKDLNNEFTITISNLIVKDNKNAFNRLSNPIFVHIYKKNNNVESMIKIDKNIFDFKGLKNDDKYNLLMTVSHKSMENILYELYKLKFLETKQTDNKEIAKGINLSFGVSSYDVISKNKFIKKSMPRFIDLFISEIESNDIFNRYNQNNQLSIVLNDLLTKSGKFNYIIKTTPKKLKKER